MFISNHVIADKQKIWLIGGGNILHNSQEQIEKNVLWLDQLFRQHSNEENYKVYFGLGDAPGNDVLYFSKDSSADNLILQHVFNKKAQTGLKYKRHSLTSLNGGTQIKKLSLSLTDDFKQLAEDENILFVYNGHGGREYNNEKDNYLKLWGDTRLKVNELSALFDIAPQSSTVRFVLTQCYSGAFYNLINNTFNPNKINKQRRCGFMAESDVRQSEGCTLDTNPEEFRDYTTYFFAALDGQSRTGSELLSNPDINNDNRVSFREAHLYTLKSARNKDLSRSTSEMYLEKWQPWYLRWQPYSNNTTSIYWQLALDVAKLNALPMNSYKLIKVRPVIVNKLETVNKQVLTFEKKIKFLQKNIQLDLNKKWPNLQYSIEMGILNPYTKNKHEIIMLIKNHRKYTQLVETSDQYQLLLHSQLTLERDLAQIDKISRLKKIAWLESQFSQYASENEKKQYAELLNCEESGYL